jgi:hypothetical protein
MERLKQLDWLGPLFFIPAISCLLLALQWGGTIYNWNSAPVLSMFIAFAVITPIWVYTQYRLGENATIPWRIISNRTTFFASIFGFTSAGAFTILSYYVPLYFQAVKGADPLQSGIDVLPVIGSATVSSIIAGFIISISGYYNPVMIVGMALSTVGIALMTTFGIDTSVGKWIGFQVIAGLVGLNLQVLTFAFLINVRPHLLPFKRSVRFTMCPSQQQFRYSSHNSPAQYFLQLLKPSSSMNYCRR